MNSNSFQIINSNSFQLPNELIYFIVKCIFALILVLIIFKHPKYGIRKNCVDMCARDGRRQWRAEGGGERGDGPGHPRQGGIERVKSQKLKCCD